MTEASSSQRWRAPVAIVAIGVAAACYYAFGLQSGGPKIRDNVDVRITAIDVSKSQIKAEFIHPRDGRTYPIVAQVDDTCEITIDGAPAKLSDLVVGDRAVGKGALKDGVIQPMAIRVTRGAKDASLTQSGESNHGGHATGG